MKNKTLAIFGFLLAVTLVAFGATMSRLNIINSIINNTPIGQTTAAPVNTTVLKLNGAGPLNHTLCGDGTSYVDCGATHVEYGLTFTSCSTGTGQPTQCTGSFTLPVNMPDANYQIACSTNPDDAANSHISIHQGLPLPTTSGSSIGYSLTQTMQNGTGGQTPQIMCILLHN